MKCMYVHCPWVPMDTTIWLVLSVLLLFLLVIKTSRRIRSEQKEICDRSAKNQEAMVALLTEIRDALRK